MLKKPLKFIGLGIIVLLITAVFMKQELLISLQRRFQNLVYDYNSANSEIVIASIDEKSLQADKLGPFSKWKREYYAQAIENLNKAGAAVIGIDVTFPDPSFHGPDDDKTLQQALTENLNVILASRYYFENSEQKSEQPNETISQAQPKTGWINVSLDDDNFVRKLPVVATLHNKTTEAFSLAVARVYTSADYGDTRVTDNQFAFSDDVRIPVMTSVDSKANKTAYLMYINYFAEPNGFTTISFSDILDGRFVDKKGQPIDFKDKIVLIGPTAADLQDSYASPVSRGVQMSGVEIHANNVQTIVERKFLHDQSPLSLWLTLLGLTAVSLTLFAFLKVRYAIPLVVAEIFGILVAGIIGYEFRIFMNIISPTVAVLLSFVGAYLLRFILEEKEKRFIQNAFGHYVNKEVVKQIIHDPSALRLGGEKRPVTVFFSDIKDFTSIAEKMKPEALVTFLNDYLTDMTDIILKHQGMLDKYVGDAIMALWNAPLTQADHARNACLAALENKKRLEVLCAKWKGEGKPDFQIRIGIHTGEAVVGNMGSKTHFDYTAMGDNVNLASRLEGISKEYGTSIIVSEATMKTAGDSLNYRELDLIRVKGRQEPVRIYELVDNGERVAVSGEQVAVSGQYQIFLEALALYRKQSFDEAKAKFESIPNDPPAVVFANRCAEFLKNPPEEGWDGVWVFTTK